MIASVNGARGIVPSFIDCEFIVANVDIHIYIYNNNSIDITIYT
jgi:hypothetical protein